MRVRVTVPEWMTGLSSAIGIGRVPSPSCTPPNPLKQTQGTEQEAPRTAASQRGWWPKMATLGGTTELP